MSINKQEMSINKQEPNMSNVMSNSITRMN